MRDNHIPGVAIAIVRDGRTIYKQGYGLANAETGEPVDPDRTIFRIGSISKALTLLTLTLLIDDGGVSRSDDVAAYFPDMAIENPAGFEDPVTIDHLLTHTTGFDQPGYGRQIGEFERSLEERKAMRPSLPEFLGDRNLRRFNAPGDYFVYDTYGATLAGAIIERVTGLPYADAMKQEMFTPLGMMRTSVEAAPQNLPDLAKGHGYVDSEYVTMPYEVYVTPPASSIDATAADIGRLLEALTGGGANAAGRLFSEETSRAVLDPQYRPHPEFAGMTHGLWESLQLGRGADAIPVRTLWHGGDMWGFNSQMEIVPEYNLAIFVAANRNSEGGGPVVKIARPVMRAIMGVLDPDRAAEAAEVPPRDPNMDLSGYVGDYYWPTYCHACTDDEFALGAWRRQDAIEVRSSNGALQIWDQDFLPLGDDVLVNADGFEPLFFKRNEAGDVTSFSRREGPAAYERAG